MFRLYTHNDLDGVGCGIVAKMAFGEHVEVRYNSVSGLDLQVERFLEQANQDNDSDEILFITDLSINAQNTEALDEFVKNGGKAKLIDHHKTALHFNDYSWGSVKVQYEDGRLTSATSLFYDYLIKNHLIDPTGALDEFVELVRQYDTWEWDQNDNIKAKHLNDLFFMVSIEEFEERMTTRVQENEHFEYDDFEQKLLEMEGEKIERYVRRKKRELVQSFIGDYCAGIVHAESYHSELGNELGKEYEHLDYIAIMNMGGKKVSFRTVHDHVDVSAVAEEFGGGGHQKAAGCTMNEKAFDLYVKTAFTCDSIRFDAFRNRYNLKDQPEGCLFESRNEGFIFIYLDKEQWRLEKNGKLTDDGFETFKEAERFVKRKYAAWLVKDDIYVDYLKDHFIKNRH